ncbi:MAG: hypothetical protein JNJ44_03385 [Zoogloeaceae bacterium]|nr:hypothetical protein [Zoogloeaceae bacterium]
MSAIEFASVVAAISQRLRELAVPWIGGAAGFADPARLELAPRTDPFTGQATLVGKWSPDAQGRRGAVTLNDDGSFFAEHDVLVWQGTHFVEAVTVWGRPGVMKGEARFLDETGEPAAGRHAGQGGGGWNSN